MLYSNFWFPLKNKSYLVICKRCISRHHGETPKTWLLCETSYCEATQGKHTIREISEKVKRSKSVVGRVGKSYNDTGKIVLLKPADPAKPRQEKIE